MHAIVLLAHGSRNPDWKRPLEAVLARTRALAPDRPVELAYLERSEPDVFSVSKELVERGATAIELVAVFLAPGGHVRSDIPRLVDELQSKHPGLKVGFSGQALGERDEVIDALARTALADVKTKS